VRLWMNSIEVLGLTTLALALHAPGEKYSDSVASLSTNKFFSSSSSSLLGVHASAMAVCGTQTVTFFFCSCVLEYSLHVPPRDGSLTT
jgi:hypothetical protein